MTEQQTQTNTNDTPPASTDTAAGGGSSAPWYGDGLTDEDVGFIQNKQWEGAQDVVKSYRELEKLNGVPKERLLKLPEDMSDVEALNSIYDKLGRPESADKYSMGEVPEGLTINEGFRDKMFNVAHAAGLSESQFKALSEAYNGSIAEQIAEAQAADQEAGQAELQALQKEWGSAYEGRTALAKRAIKAFGADEATLQLLESGTGAAGLIKLFANIGEKLGEDKFVDDNTPGGKSFTKTPEQLKADKESLMNEIKANPDRLAAYNKGQGNDYQRVKRLNEMLYGD